MFDSGEPMKRVGKGVTLGIMVLLALAGDVGAVDLSHPPVLKADQEQAPVWTSGYLVTDRARALMSQLVAAGTEGLDPADYHLERLHRLMAFVGVEPGLVWADADAVVEAEALLGAAFLAFGRDLARGRVVPEEIWEKWRVKGRRPDPRPELLAAMTAWSRGDDRLGVAEVLARCRPEDRGYEALRDALVGLDRIVGMGGWPEVAAGATLRPGMVDPRVRALRHRLALAGDLQDPRWALPLPWGGRPAGALYDAPLIAAVERFQRRHGLGADGIVGPQTLAALNVTAATRRDQVALNLERWRWLPGGFTGRHVTVNIPDFSLTLVEDGRPRLRMRAIVGRPDRPTPVLSGRLNWLETNPYWNVPQKLARRDLLPKVIADLDYLTDRGFAVFANWRPGAPELDPMAVDWSAVVPWDMAYKFQQGPGPRNALGRIKFFFPNEFSVYLHDTNHPDAFDRGRRCLSSGCVRIENPDGLLEALLATAVGAADTTVSAALASGENLVIRLPAPVPVHLVYLTAWVDVERGLQFREDCYGYDADLASALATGSRPLLPTTAAASATLALEEAPLPAGTGPIYQVRTGPVSTWMNPGPE